MIDLLAMKRTYPVLGITGYSFLVIYLIVIRDFTFSIPWTFGFFAIAVSVAVSVATLMHVLKLPERFPKLESHHFACKAPEAERPLTHDEWKKKYEEWEEQKREYDSSRIRLRSIVHTPAEDGLNCVPVILVGINPVSAIVSGLVFGFLHLRTCTYLDCISKAVNYSLVCLIILPHGLLTVVAGHFLNDLIAWVAMKVIVKYASKGHSGTE